MSVVDVNRSRSGKLDGSTIIHFQLWQSGVNLQLFPIFQWALQGRMDFGRSAEIRGLCRCIGSEQRLQGDRLCVECSFRKVVAGEIDLCLCSYSAMDCLRGEIRRCHMVRK
jgi:hypothetical protein